MIQQSQVDDLIPVSFDEEKESEKIEIPANEKAKA
jgi:hypothetical protein